ncbi:MAG: hypothetical protein Q9207_007956 [Kuettlingeria erythrocarpa]
MDTSPRRLEKQTPSISHTVSSVTDLPIPSQKEARDSQDKPSPKTPPVLRRPSRIKHRPQDDIEVQSLLQGDDIMRQDLGGASADYLAQLSLQTQPHSVHLIELPVEVQEGVIDNLAGHMIGTSTAPCGPRNWSTAMRHPRRKQLSDLALVSKTWRGLIQQRLYRHIKVKGTIGGINECREWFCKHPHLRLHVRHFEVWVPVWEIKASRRPTDIPPIPSAFTPRPDMRGVRVNGRMPIIVQDISDMTQAFQQSSTNASLDDIFRLTRDVFPEVYVLTIEGGQGKRTPQVRVHRHPQRTAPWGPIRVNLPTFRRLAINPQIGSLVVKGAWNVIREPNDYFVLQAALPNLREYHCIYSKPKTQAYLAMCSVLRFLPPSINSLNICLEGLTSKPTSSPEKWRLMHSSNHICTDIGRVLPWLESFSYTGRVCRSIFRDACKYAQSMRDTSRLKSIDLIVRNCCRPGVDPGSSNDATGIYQMDFIIAFKNLVIEAVRSLSVFESVNYLRIRFLDLDSPNPLLNPYFQLQGNSVMGIWNDEILSLLKAVRPNAEYDCLDMADCGTPHRDAFADNLLGGLVPLPRGGRPKSMNVDAYAALAEARV